MTLLFLISLTASSAEQVLISSLAQVDEVVLTSRDLVVYQFFNEKEDIFNALTEETSPLKKMVWEQLIAKESVAVFEKPLSKFEIQEAKKKWDFRSDQLWRRLKISSKELDQCVRRRLNASRLVALKMPKNLIYVSETEVLAYYKKNKGRFGKQPLDLLREKIRVGLQRRKAKERFNQWVDRLQKHHSVRFYSGFKVSQK